jgi:hypothetical protein
MGNGNDKGEMRGLSTAAAETPPPVEMTSLWWFGQKPIADPYEITNKRIGYGMTTKVKATTR